MQCNVLIRFGNQLTMYFVLPEVLFVINESAVYWTTSNYLAGQLNLVFGDQLPILENIGILFTGVFTKCKFGYLQHCIRENSRLSLSGRFQKSSHWGFLMCFQRNKIHMYCQRWPPCTELYDSLEISKLKAVEYGILHTE